MRAWHGKNSWPARFVRACDGDTVIVRIALGFGVSIERRVRLVGIDSWELGSGDDAKAQLARDKIDDLLRGKHVLVFPATRSDDRYGRLRARLTVDGADLAEFLVDNGLAWRVPVTFTHNNAPGCPRIDPVATAR